MTGKYTYRRLVDGFLHMAEDFSGHIKDDRIYSKQYLTEIIIDTRAEVLRSASITGQGISEFYSQTIDCIELCEVDVQECPCAPPSGCYWMKTKHPIPNPLQMISVTDSMGREQFTHKKWTDFKRISNSRIKSARTKRYYTYKESGNGDYYLYVYASEEDKTFLRAITVTAIFSNTLKAAAYPRCGEQNLEAICNPMDQPIFLEEELRAKVKNTLFALLPQVKANAPQDQLNNDRADRGRYERNP